MKQNVATTHTHGHTHTIWSSRPREIRTWMGEVDANPTPVILLQFLKLIVCSPINEDDNDEYQLKPATGPATAGTASRRRNMGILEDRAAGEPQRAAPIGSGA